MPEVSPPHEHDHAHAAGHHPGHDHGHQQSGLSAPVAPVGPVTADASVRLARPTDAPAVGLVQAVVWREAYAAAVPPEVLETFQPQAFASAWRASLDRPPGPAYRLLVACAGDQVVGFAAVGPSGDADASPTDAELLVLGVHPEARRAGHGSRLLNAAVDTVRGSGFTTLRAWLPADDLEARGFLGAAGLEPDGARRERVVGLGTADVASEVRVGGALDEG
jgi:GNAT superfamily N-acetyltransferase